MGHGLAAQACHLVQPESLAPAAVSPLNADDTVARRRKRGDIRRSASPPQGRAVQRLIE